MFYAIEYTYGRTIQNDNGGRGDRVLEFTRRELRDAWVNDGTLLDGPGNRENLSARHPFVRKAHGLENGDGDGWQVLAIARVDASAALGRYRDNLLIYDWMEPDHLKWVATAPEREIISWARAVQ